MLSGNYLKDRKKHQIDKNQQKEFTISKEKEV